MLRKLLTVGGWTLVSRVTGLVRDVILAAILGTGPVADAFFVALRIPNHFRAIFGEGAFNAAFVPALTRIDEQEGRAAAALFQGRVATILVAVQIVVLGVALAFMPRLVGLLAPGFLGEAERFDLAVTLTTITFPYLLLISLVTLYAAVLNAGGRFAVAAAAPVLLNIGIVLALLGASLFPTAGHAAAWGVTAAGVAELALLVAAARRSGLLAPLGFPRFDQAVKDFFRKIGPATLGSMGTQIALFADTILATTLAVGAVSALYYADRLYQLPIGVVGIAAGTVILPEMSRLIAAGRPGDAHAAQNRAMLLTLVATAPFAAAFLVVPDLIMRAMFLRGAFDAASAEAAGATLLAYAVGLPAVVLIRSAVASFYASGDTTTPLWASVSGVAVNVALKLALIGPLAQAGLALATSVGAWMNLALLVLLAARRGLNDLDRRFWAGVGVIAVAGLGMAAALHVAALVGTPLVATLPRGLRDPVLLAGVGAVGGMAYLVLLLLGARRARLPLPPWPRRR